MGKLKQLFISILLLSFCIPALISAAPAQWGIAINDEREECAGYWAGDEFSHYSLPQGWTSYVPDFDEDFNTYIDTPYGRCDFSEYSEESCCRQLELPYVSEQIGEFHSTGLCSDCIDNMEYTPIIPIVIACCCLSLAIVLLVAILIIVKKDKRKKK